MAKGSLLLIDALRATARELQLSSNYQWGHMGSCNCGFLAQQITRLSNTEIHRRAMQRYGDWNEQLNDYCAMSGLPFDGIIDSLLSAGFDVDDLKHLERLSDPLILSKLEPGRFLRHNQKEDVIIYLNTWATLLEAELLAALSLDAALLQNEVTAS